MHEVESVTKISSTKDLTVSLIRCKKTENIEMPIEALTVCGCRRLGDHQLVIRTSVETD